MKAQTMMVTPEMANTWLENNTCNRKLDPKRVKLYKEAMMAGRWETNGESICFDESGRLRNGQHRLKAIVESGATLMLVVVTDVPFTTNTFDVGKNRTEIDYATLRGFDLNSAILAAASLVYYDGGEKRFIRSEKIDYIQRDLTEWHKSNKYCRRGVSDSIMKKAGCLAAVFIALKEGLLTDESAEAFCQIVNTNRPNEGYVPDAALILFRTLSQGIKINDKDVSHGHAFGTACLEITYRAINDFVAGKRPKQNYKPDGKAVDLCKSFKKTRIDQIKMVV